MNIFVAFNDNYAMPTRVMLTSLIKNNQCPLNIYVLYAELSNESMKYISELNSSAAAIHFIQIDKSLLDNMPVMSFYSKEAYIRLFAHDYLPENVDRILWLDSDMIVIGDIREFYDQSFDDKLYVAYKDLDQGDSAEKKASLGMPADAIYINTGILLMNIKEIRKKVKTEMITSYIKENSNKIELVDQDVLNGLLYDSVKVIDSDNTYNYFTKQIMPWNRHMVFRNAQIIHYATDKKPWNAAYPYYGFQLWWKYALMTDVNLKSRYRRIFLSCYLANVIFWAKKQLERKAPKLYKYLKEQREKLNKSQG